MPHSQRKFKVFVARIPFNLNVLLIVFLAVTVRAEIYSWTDEQGTRHFSDNPPQQSADVKVTREIPHDNAADERQSDAYRRMMEDIAAQQQLEKEAEEKAILKKRLEEAERQSRAAEKKADAALKAAEEAQAVASEKQRYREIYVIPREAIGPYPGKRKTR
jgi:type IV secretory pathway VirB10-like protein